MYSFCSAIKIEIIKLNYFFLVLIGALVLFVARLIFDLRVPTGFTPVPTDSTCAVFAGFLLGYEIRLNFCSLRILFTTNDFCVVTALGIFEDVVGFDLVDLRFLGLRNTFFAVLFRRLRIFSSALSAPS